MISPGSSLLTEGDVQYRLSASGADCVVCGPNHMDGVDKAHEAIRDEGTNLLKVVVGAQGQVK